jgi:hypothetical protein
MRKIRPSSLPILKHCPQFESDNIERDHSDAGTQRHLALRELNETGKPGEHCAALDADSMEAVTWANDYINLNSNGPCVWEEKVTNAVTILGVPIDISGTPDARDEQGNVFDLKSRYRDAGGQMAAYADGIMTSEFEDSIKVHVLYTIPEGKPTAYTITADEALDTIWDILMPVIDGAPAQPCDYCNWCSKVTTCEALTSRVEAVRAGRDDWELEQYHSSEIADPAQMSKALTLAKAIKKWAAAVEYHASVMSMKNGGLPGFEQQTRKGKRAINDLSTACQLSQLTPDQFLSVCSAPLGKIKEKYHEVHGGEYVSKAACDRSIVDKLESVIEFGADSISLVKSKGA